MTNKISFTISRRRFSEILIGLVSLFFASGAVAAILKYLWPQSVEATSSEVKIASVDDVTTGTAKKFIFNGKAAVLLKMPAGFRAFGAVCTHLGCIAYWKPEENDIFCPCHLGRYDPNTGAVISGPPPSPLPAIDIIVKEGVIYALKWKDPDYVKSISFYAGAA
jgi:cytochrome b6-f complex iron-sulfur subunit